MAGIGLIFEYLSTVWRSANGSVSQWLRREPLESPALTTPLEWGSPDESLLERMRRFAQLNPLFLAAIAILTGVVTDRLIEPSAILTLVAAVMVSSVSFYLSRMRWVGILVMLVALGVVRHQSWRNDYQSAGLNSSGWSDLLDRDSFGTIVDGTITQIPRVSRHPMADASFRRLESPWQTLTVLSVSRIRSRGQMVPVSGNLRLVIDGIAGDLILGDQVRVFGNLSQATVATNPGGRDLSSIDENIAVHGRLHADGPKQVDILSRSYSVHSRVGKWLADLAWFGRQSLREHLGEHNGRLASGVVIGSRDAVPGSVQDQLLVTGTVHWLSVSGLHLAIVVSIVVAIGRIFSAPRWAQVLMLLGVCLFYTALTGGRPPVIRAAILVATFVLAIHSGRAAQMINTLSLAAIVLMMMDPRNVFGIGVHLSFLAVGTLLIAGRSLVAPRTLARDASEGAETRFDEMVLQGHSRITALSFQAFRFVGKLLWSSACVTAISMPLVWYHFHVVSPVSVLVNVVLSPLLFLALGMGLATVIAAMIHPTLANVLGSVASSVIDVMMTVIGWAADWPLGHAWLPSPPVAMVIVFYVGIAVTLFWRSTKRLRIARLIWIGSWTVVALISCLRQSPIDAGTLEATFVDVGHGCAVVIRHQDQAWLYDCGWLGNDNHRGADIENVLWSMGLSGLDGVILSHADSDHFNALPAIIRRFSVGEIVTPPGMLNEPEAALDAIRKRIAETEIPVREVSRGDTITPWMIVRHPGKVRTLGSDNANSLVIEMVNADAVGPPRRLILPGDLEPPGTAVVAGSERPPAGSILMAPHHGSTRMDAELVLRFYRPSQVIVSGGRRARKPEVSEMLSTGNARIFVTSRDGAVRVRVNTGGAIETQSWLANPW